MDNHRKAAVVALLGAACALLVLLSASLPHLEFQPGRGFSLGQTTTGAGLGIVPQGGGEILLLLFRGVMLVALVLLPISIVVNLLNREGRTRLLVNLLAILGLLLLLNRLALNPAEPLALEPEPALPAQTPLESASSGPTDRFVARVPSWLEGLAVVVLAVLASGAAAGVLWWLRKRRDLLPPHPITRLAQSAQDAIDALRSGESVEDAVIRSYLHMSRVLQEERDIQRESAMTPREFEHLLAQLGFPPAPVQELTRLFEKARYGSQLSGEREEQRAVASLRAIVTHCREAGGAQ